MLEVNGEWRQDSPKVSNASSPGRGCRTIIETDADTAVYYPTLLSIFGGIARYIYRFCAPSPPEDRISHFIQVITNQYGRPGRAASNWGPDTLEGDLSLEELKKNCRDQTVDNANNRFLDDDYYASKDFNLKDIRVPILSVANWGGIHLHLRGNIEGKL